jgi:hypothetical protein
MDSAFKYGSSKMLLEIFEIIEDFRLKPNAAIMTYMLSGISKNH